MIFLSMNLLRKTLKNDDEDQVEAARGGKNRKKWRKQLEIKFKTDKIISEEEREGKMAVFVSLKRLK